jgi:ferredoxin-type protein NapH
MVFKKISLKAWRKLSQTIVGLMLTNSYVQVISTKIPYDGVLKGACVPFLNCHACPFAVFSCPIGMLQYFASIHRFPFFLLGFFITIGLVVGRAACDWLCPFGLIQDWMYKIKTRKFGIPKFLNYTKYLVLVVLVLIISYFTYENWFSRLCPFGALIAGIPWVAWNPIDPDFGAPVIEPEMIGWLYYLKMAILALFLIWFIFAKPPFCRVVCPMGAIWALFNRISLLRFKVGNECPDCGRCSQICPMELNVNNEVDSENCIKCLDCTSCEYVTAEFKF